MKMSATHESIDLTALKRQLPLPSMLSGMGLQKYCQSSCRSPLRDDQNASWGIYENAGTYRWKDFATGESGDEVDFLAKYLRLDIRKHFGLLLKVYQAMADSFMVALPVGEPSVDRLPPDRSGFASGDCDQVQQLSKLRGIRVEALQWAQARGVLVFGSWQESPVFGITDQTGKVLAIRRLDGSQFPAFNGGYERKSHLIKGSRAGWPVGVLEAQQMASIALVEGVPDFLAAHDYIVKEKLTQRCAPVAMLSASVSIPDDALPSFRDKSIVIYPHTDPSGVGIDAAARWQKQLEEVASVVQIFDLSRVSGLTQGRVKDLNDLLQWNDPVLFKNNPGLERIMPR